MPTRTRSTECALDIFTNSLNNLGPRRQLPCTDVSIHRACSGDDTPRVCYEEYGRPPCPLHPAEMNSKVCYESASCFTVADARLYLPPRAVLALPAVVAGPQMHLELYSKSVDHFRWFTPHTM